MRKVGTGVCIVCVRRSQVTGERRASGGRMERVSTERDLGSEECGRERRDGDILGKLLVVMTGYE